jgi:hypothetical protein
MEVTLEMLNEGLATIYGEKVFLPAMDYVTPFVNEMKRYTDQFVVKIQTSKQSYLYDQKIITPINRVWIQAILPEEEDGYKVTYNMMYAIDTRLPSYKFFKGYILSGRTQVVMDLDHLIIGELESKKAIPDDFKKLLDKKSDIKGWIDKLTHTQIVNKHQVLGQMINSAMVTKLELMSFRSQLSTSEILAAYSAVYTDCKLDGTLVPSDKQATLLDLYKIIVKSICEGSDTFVVAEKIIILNHIMKEVICW